MPNVIQNPTSNTFHLMVFLHFMRRSLCTLLLLPLSMHQATYQVLVAYVVNTFTPHRTGGRSTNAGTTASLSTQTHQVLGCVALKLLMFDNFSLLNWWVLPILVHLCNGTLMSLMNQMRIQACGLLSQISIQMAHKSWRSFTSTVLFVLLICLVYVTTSCQQTLVIVTPLIHLLHSL